MICVDTDGSEVRTYRMPRALADVALELFPGVDLSGAVFRLARAVSLDIAHTIERIATNRGHADAVAFARQQLENTALAARRPH